MIEVRTQAELDKALKKTEGGKKELIVCLGEGEFTLTGNSTVRAWGNSTVRAWDNSTVRAWDNSTVEAWGNSTVRAWGNSTVRAWDNSTVEAGGNSTVRAWDNSTVEAWGNSTVRAWDNSTVEAGGNSTVRAWGNSTVRAWDNSTVEAGGNSTVRAWDNSTVRAGGNSTVEARPHTPVIKSAKATDVKISGGVVIDIPVAQTAEEWCDFHGVELRDGDEVAIVFKALGDDLIANNNFAYKIGEVPTAPDWDEGKAECGGGLHFSPTPWQALQFRRDATRFIACPVKVADMCVHPDGMYPQKVKAPGCCEPIWEVDIDGNRIESGQPDAAPEGMGD